jgi:PhnB protein
MTTAEVKPIREGFHSITPYLGVPSADKMIDFLKKAFNAELTYRGTRPDGSVMHTELKIGDSYLMMGEPTGNFPAMQSSIYLYVKDCDTVYKQAIKAGGVSLMEPATQPSGERYGGVKDPAGNIWWVATHVEDVSAEEEARRWKAAFQKKQH